MKIYYAVINTNVLVSAMLKWNSIPGSIIQLALSNAIRPLYNDEIIQEYINVLKRDKFHLDTETITQVVDSMIANGTKIEPNLIDIILPDPNDKVFYEIVMEPKKTNDSYLITGNIKHFPCEQFIVTPKEMLDIVLTELNAKI